MEGQHLTVDGTLIEANASRQSCVQRERLAERAQVSRTVREYLAELNQQNRVGNSEPPFVVGSAGSGPISTTDPDAAWGYKYGPPALGYYDNYLVDNASRVIVDVEATPALFSQEAVAARRRLARVQQLGLRPESLGGDKAYRSGEFLAWLLERGIQPHIPVINRRAPYVARVNMLARPLLLRCRYRCPAKSLVARSRPHAAAVGTGNWTIPG